MSKYEQFVELLTSYCRQKGFPIQIEKSLQDSSTDDANAVKIFTSKHRNLNSISMDSIAQNVVRRLHFVGTTKESESPASVDSFLIDSDGYWYFIEFKNQKISASKEKCIEKSYANVYWLLKILDELKADGSFSFSSFSSSSASISSFEFIKEHCHFILVVGNGKDDVNLNRIREAKKAKMNLPDSCLFLRKLESYVFKIANVFSAEQFDDFFVKNFRYA